MDALFRVFGAHADPERQAALSAKYRALRATLSGFCFASDDDLAPALLLIALIECRHQTCSLQGIAILAGEAYGRPIRLSAGERPGDTPPTPPAIPVPPPGTPPLDTRPVQVAGVADFAEAKTRWNETRADEIVDRVLRVMAENPGLFDDIEIQARDFGEVQALLKSAVLSVLGQPGVH